MDREEYLSEELDLLNLVTRYKDLSSGTKGSKSLKLTEPQNGKSYSKHLLYSCLHGNTEDLQLVLKTAQTIQELNQPLVCDNGLRITPLGLASLSGNSASCNLLLKSGADANIASGCGPHCLHLAALANTPDVVETLMAGGGNPEQTDEKGLLPLHYACFKGTPKVVAAILKQSPSSIHDTSKVPDGVTPLIMAILKGHADILKMLVKKTGTNCLISPDKLGFTPVHYAAWNGDLKPMKILSKWSTFSNAITLKDIWGRTPLMVVASKGNLVLCQFLMKKGAKWNECDNEGRNLLHWSIISNQLEIVNFFITSEMGVQLFHQKDNKGVYPLHLAAAKKNPEILGALTKKFPEKLDFTSRSSPMLWAVVCDFTEGVTMLLKMYGTDEVKSTSFNALHAAASVGSVEICGKLLAAEFVVGSITEEGMTPLHYASRYGHCDVAEILIQSGAKVNALSRKEESPIHLAAIHGHSEVTRILLEAGASTGIPRGGDHSLPLHLACINGHSQVLNILLSHQVDPNQPRRGDGHTPTFIAASNGHMDCLKVLIQYGGDVSTRIHSTPEGLTPLDIAMKNGHKACENYLLYSHAPSGGGIYHRAALTIQAVWRYHRYKVCQSIAREWAVMILQRSVKAWLLRLKSYRVRKARHAAYNKAASCIQRRWKEYMVQKRRYESTYNRLKIKLQQEQLATSLIVAELQAQTQRIKLPSSTQTLDGAANVLVAGRILNERIKNGKHVNPSFSKKQSRTLISHPKPLKGCLPAIKIKNKKSLCADLSKTTRNGSSNNDVFQFRQPVSLPPNLEDTSRLHSLSPITETKTPIRFSKHKRKLPPIKSHDMEGKSTERSDIKERKEKELLLNTVADTKTEELTSADSNRLDGCNSISFQPVGITKRPLRTSTFKDALLCYQPFSAKTVDITPNDGKTSEHEHLQDSIHSLDSNLPSREEYEAPLALESPAMLETETTDSLLTSDEIASNVLNKVERYEKLMKVLTLLKQAKQLEKKEGHALEEMGTPTEQRSGQGLEAIREHIKEALDEAIKLRQEMGVEI